MTPYTEYAMRSVVIQNWAYSGESTGSFWRKGKFDNLLNEVKPGDYVLVQFGHNDSVRGRISVYTSESEYKKNLMVFAKACQARGAKCIFLSPTPRCVIEGNRIAATLPSYKSAMKSAAFALNVPFVDTGKMVEDYMNTVGKTMARSYYMLFKPGQYPNYPDGIHDKSHFNHTGADKAAHIIAVTLRENKQVPKALTKHITAPSDYYKGVVVDVKKVKVSKKKITLPKTKKAKKQKVKKQKTKKLKAKKQYVLSWKKQKKAKYYIVYRYLPSKKTYKKVGTTRKETYILEKEWTKKELSNVKVKAVLCR